MTRHRTIGDILISVGRITAADAECALEHQRNHGGYFGEALVALGLASREELEWSLASQFDLPYVIPDAGTIDPDAAAIVSPEWALAHLTLPIMMTAETLTVIVDSPVKTVAMEELRQRTDLRIELALAPGSKIRELIRQIYSRTPVLSDPEEAVPPIGLLAFLGSALDAGADRFGISSRGVRAIGWYEGDSGVHRHPLDSRWKLELDERVSPPTSRQIAGSARGEWSGMLDCNGVVSPLEIRLLVAEGGLELLFTPVDEATQARTRFGLPESDFITEVRLLARSGPVHFIVVTDPPELGSEILPHLPGILLDPEWRSLHLTDQASTGEETGFTVCVPEDPNERSEFVEDLRRFHFDVLSGAMTGSILEWMPRLAELAPVGFFLWSDGEDRRAAQESGIRWEIQISRATGGELAWDLGPLHVQQG